jgi:hypothetical protein
VALGGVGGVRAQTQNIQSAYHELVLSMENYKFARQFPERLDLFKKMETIGV